MARTGYLKLTAEGKRNPLPRLAQFSSWDATPPVLSAIGIGFRSRQTYGWRGPGTGGAICWRCRDACGPSSV